MLKLVFQVNVMFHDCSRYLQMFQSRTMPLQFTIISRQIFGTFSYRSNGKFIDEKRVKMANRFLQYKQQCSTFQSDRKAEHLIPQTHMIHASAPLSMCTVIVTYKLYALLLMQFSHKIIITGSTKGVNSMKRFSIRCSIE